MKVIVEYIPNSPLGTTLEEYNRYYKEEGFLYNELWEAVYYYVDLPYVPREGERVFTRFGICIVEYSYYALEPSDDYDCQSKIAVKEE